MRKLTVILGSLALAAAAFAESDPVAVPRLESIRLGKDNQYQIQTLRVKDDLILPAGKIVAADLADGAVTSDKIDTVAAEDVVWTAAAQNVTNGQAVVLVAGKINVLNGVGQVADETNTITIANFAAADVGKITYVANAYGATNWVAIAQTGNFYGDAIELQNGDSMALFATATNVLYGK